MRKYIKVFAAAFMMIFIITACGKTEADNNNVASEPEITTTQEDFETDIVTAKEEPEPDIITTKEKPEPEDTMLEETMPDEAAVDQEEVPLQASSPWAGKKVSICGDSISTFTGYIPEYYSKFYPENGDITEVNNTWWMQVLNNTGMELCANASYSGATVSGLSQDSQDGRYGCGNQRMDDLTGTDGSLPEVIIILMGANDLLIDIPIGFYDGVSTVEEGNIENFCEAYALMLQKINSWYPDAEVYCCTMTEVSRWIDETGEKFPYKNKHGLTAADYNTWIASIAKAKGANVIDVYDCGLTYENAKEYTSDGTHPNAAGAKLIADKISKSFP